MWLEGHFSLQIFPTVNLLDIKIEVALWKRYSTIKQNIMALLALSGRHDILSGIFPTELHCYASMCFFHTVVLLGELEGSSLVCGKAMNGNFPLFEILSCTHCSLTPTIVLSRVGTFYLEIQVFISYRNPSTTIRWQRIQQCCPPGTSQTRGLDMRSCSVTHYSSPKPAYISLCSG